MNEKKILLTGGAGYIGSHTYVSLKDAGFSPVIFDNFSCSHESVINRLEKITNRPVCYEAGDVRVAERLKEVFQIHQPIGVIHFAGLKAVGESVKNPLEYFDNNINGTICLLKTMSDFYIHESKNIPILVFSSSATVYGKPDYLPIQESASRSFTNPYGQTKLVIEDMLNALSLAQPNWRMGILRYFNPVGAHFSGLIGEDPLDIPNNLMPYIAQVASKRRECLNVWGNDYQTLDGTGVRDYIHVMDLAEGHVATLKYLIKHSGGLTLNLGTGKGTSVLELIKAFEKASHRTIPFEIGPRRNGDVDECWADPSLANKLLGWSANRTLDQMCEDAWKWEMQRNKFN